MPSVDVFIPNYQYGNYLTGCVESVLNQDVQDLRVVIIDNASTDNSVEVAHSLAATDSRIQVVAHPVNLGHVASFNEAIDLATADYFMALNADELLTPGCLRRALWIMQTRPDVSFAYGDGVMCGEKDATPRPILGRMGRWKISTSEEYIAKFCRTPFRSAGFILIRTMVQKRAGHYRLTLGGDLEMQLRLARLGPVAETNVVQGHWRQEGLNISKVFWDDFVRRVQIAESTFESFFSHEGSVMAGAGRLRRSARMTIGSYAYWSGLSHFVRGQWRQGTVLFGYAFRLSPLTVVVPPIVRLLRRGHWIARVREIVREGIAGKRA
jgi:glycosyltransferase involved in cell wall biosynthesis